VGASELRLELANVYIYIFLQTSAAFRIWILAFQVINMSLPKQDPTHDPAPLRIWRSSWLNPNNNKSGEKSNLENPSLRAMYDSNTQLAKPKWGNLSKQGEICVHLRNNNNNIIRKQNITRSQQKNHYQNILHCTDR
jgi:hypothetical protein